MNKQKKRRLDLMGRCTHNYCFVLWHMACIVPIFHKILLSTTANNHINDTITHVPLGITRLAFFNCMSKLVSSKYLCNKKLYSCSYTEEKL